MPARQKIIIAFMLLIAASVFVLFIRPNSVASENMAMIVVFEPDEANPLPYLLRMIAPAENLDKTLRAFLFYGFYYYGFPHFALSALSILPLKLMGRLNDLPLLMTVLRQAISVLPMLLALLLLVYMQDGFRSYRSPVLFVFLLSIPAVVSNNFWWHPDSLTFLLVVLTLFLLRRDNLRFGKNFLLAAFVTGLVTATKMVGLYFFLAVGLTLLLGLVLKKASLKRLAGMGLAYIGLMALAFLVGNPFLLSHWARLEYWYTLQKTTNLLSEGYSIVYDKGLMAAWPIMHDFYGEGIVILLALGCAIWGAWRGPQRLLHGLILAWFFPLTISLLLVTHFKYQYWLPVALPLFSCLVLLLPERLDFSRAGSKLRFVQYGLVLVVAVQFALNMASDIPRYDRRLHRGETDERIAFYNQAVTTLAPLTSESTFVYHDYRMYMPETPGWKTDTNYELLEYDYIQQSNFDVLLLLEQRIRDYLNEGVQGVDPVAFARNQQFYRDADSDAINGYRLVYRNPVGLIYVREDLYQQTTGQSP